MAGAGQSGARELTVDPGHHEGEVERLAPVEARVTSGLVALVQMLLGDLVAATDALGDVVAGEFDVDPAGMGAQLPVHLEEASHLIEHIVESPGLMAARGIERVAMHRVADPGERSPSCHDRLDQRWQGVPHEPRAHARDES